MLNIVLFGPPGSGKGTQSKMISAKYHLSHIATGDLLRDEMARETKLGLEAMKFMNNGMLVPDELVISVINSKLNEQPADVEGFNFDGFPRTVTQAEALDSIMEDRKISISCVIFLNVKEHELIKRIEIRKQHSNRADDASEKIIRQRIAEYESKTAPVAEYYKKQGKFIGVKGEGTIDDIAHSIIEELDTVKAGNISLGTPGTE